MRACVFLATAIFMAPFLAPFLGLAPALAQDRVALVIGNDRYGNLPSDKQLNKAVNDARAVGGALQKLGFKVIRGENLNRAQMVDHVFNFTQAIKPGDTAIVFFAGHGVSFSGGNYLLPTDIPLPKQGEETRARNLSLGEADIIADIQERKPRVVVMMLDACRDNPFRQPGLTRSIGNEAGLTRGREAEGVFSIYSAGFGQTALDTLGANDKSPNSVFTRALVPALARTDVHLADLVIDMREEVSRLAATIGHQQYPAYYDQTRGGRIYLAGRPAAATPQPAQPGPAAPAPKAPVIAALPPPSEALGRVWEVEELDGWRGTWTRRGNTGVFDGSFVHRSGERETATLEIGIANNRVTVERSQSNGKCRYEGRLNGRNVTGTYGCDWATGPFEWKADIRNSAAELAPAPQKPQALAALPQPSSAPPASLRESWQRRIDSVVWAAAMTRDGRTLAIGKNDIQIVNADDGKTLRTLAAHKNSVNGLAFSSDGKLLISASDEKQVKIWDPSSGALIRSLESKSPGYAAVAFSPDGLRIAAGGGDKQVSVWEVGGRLIRTFTGDSITIRALAFSPDGRLIAVGGGYLGLFDSTSGALVRKFENRPGIISSLAFSADGRRLVAGSTNGDGPVEIWEVATGRSLKMLSGPTNNVETLAISPDGRRIVSGGPDKQVRLWDAETGQVLQTIEGHTDKIRGVSYSADGRRVMWGDWDGLVRVYAAQ